jgi:hypothetical protein
MFLIVMFPPHEALRCQPHLPLLLPQTLAAAPASSAPTAPTP